MNKKGLNPSLTGMVIGLIVVSGLTGIFALFIADSASHYNPEYNMTQIEKFNRMVDMRGETDLIKNQTEDISEREGLTDILGGYFSAAYKAMMVTKGSYDVLDNMTDEAMTQAHLGAAGNYVKDIIALSILILIFLGVIVSVIVGGRKPPM